MLQSLIHIRDLTLRLDGQEILWDFSLDVFPGEYLALVGANGAGKTSLIKCLAGIQRAWQGQIQIDGRDLRQYRQRALARRLSYVPQAADGDIPFTCREYVLMARYPHLSPFTSLRQADHDLVEQCLIRTGVIALRDRQIATLSGGERQMVAIAAALAQGAAIMLLDEPTAFLDYRHQQEVLRMLGDLNRQHGLTIVTAIHDINAACRWSTRVAALRAGRLLSCVPPEEILQPAMLAKIYDTHFAMAAMPDGRRLAALEAGP